MEFRTLGVALCAAFFVAPAWAEDTVKIGYIDPLSGGGASIGADRPEDLPVSRRRDSTRLAA